MAAPGRFSQLRWLQTLVCVVAMLGAGILIGLGILGYGDSPEISSRVWLVTAGGFVLFASLVVLTITPLLLKIEATNARQLSELRDANEVLLKHLTRLELIAENTRISDAAKSLSHRAEELDALREAIRDDIRNERWDAANSLADEIAERFGFTEESERLREELLAAQKVAIERKLGEALEMVESHFRTREWERAQHEIDRLAKALPDDARVTQLKDRMAALREDHKAELLREWDEAVQRSDTDHAIEVLKELDQYLEPDEADKLSAAARSVFKEKLLQLGVQFRFAFKEKRWQDSLDIGLELVRDFPNARMAREVREMLDVLRERARQAAHAAKAEA